jgi:hypothetical protein
MNMLPASRVTNPQPARQGSQHPTIALLTPAPDHPPLLPGSLQTASSTGSLRDRASSAEWTEALAAAARPTRPSGGDAGAQARHRHTRSSSFNDLEGLRAAAATPAGNPGTSPAAAEPQTRQRVAEPQARQGCQRR